MPITGREGQSQDRIFMFGGLQAQQLVFNVGASAGNVATLNVPVGTITLQTTTIPAGGAASLSITNSFVRSSFDVALCAVRNNSNTGGRPTIGNYSTTPGVLAITIVNASATGPDGGGPGGGMVNGTLDVSFFLVNAPYTTSQGGIGAA